MERPCADELAGIRMTLPFEVQRRTTGCERLRPASTGFCRSVPLSTVRRIGRMTCENRAGAKEPAGSAAAVNPPGVAESHRRFTRVAPQLLVATRPGILG